MSDFDRDKPAGNQKVRLADDDIRTNNYALQEAIGRDHKFPTGDGTDSGEHLQIIFNAVLGADPDPGTGKFAIYPKDNGAGDPDLFCQDENNTVLKLFYGEAGTVMIFGQNSAPTGWTRKADWADTSMLCYAATGDCGSGGSANPQSTHTHTGPSHTHTLSAHTHTGPSHTHTVVDHAHDLANHTHTAPSHTHTGPSHAHTVSAHNHDLQNHTHTGPSHTHTGPSHTHTGPSHTHESGLYYKGTSTTGIAYVPTAVGGVSLTVSKSDPDDTGLTSTVYPILTGAGGTGATGAEGTGATSAAGTGATGAPSSNATSTVSANSTSAAGTDATGAGGASATGGPSSNSTSSAGGQTSSASGTGATAGPSSDATGAEGTGATGASTAVLYQEVIAATRDA